MRQSLYWIIVIVMSIMITHISYAAPKKIGRSGRLNSVVDTPQARNPRDGVERVRRIYLQNTGRNRIAVALELARALNAPAEPLNRDRLVGMTFFQMPQTPTNELLNNDQNIRFRQFPLAGALPWNDAVEENQRRARIWTALEGTRNRVPQVWFRVEFNLDQPPRVVVLEIAPWEETLPLLLHYGELITRFNQLYERRARVLTEEPTITFLEPVQGGTAATDDATALPNNPVEEDAPTPINAAAIPPVSRPVTAKAGEEESEEDELVSDDRYRFAFLRGDFNPPPPPPAASASGGYW